MSAYPFAPAPTVEHFIQVALQHGAQFASLDGHLYGPGGEVPTEYLHREVDAVRYMWRIPSNRLQRMTVTVLRSACGELGLDLSQLGLGYDLG